MRKFTNILIMMLDEGIISHEKVAMMALGYLSEADVKEMMESNDVFVGEFLTRNYREL
jgi:membrane-bound lytic murein transglycosylase